MQVLRDSRRGLGGALQRVQKVVLQQPRFDLGLAHCEPLGSSQAQGGHFTQRWSLGRNRPRVLQLWLQKCLHFGLHSSKGRFCGCASLQAALRRTKFAQGHELGTRPVEATHQ